MRNQAGSNWCYAYFTADMYSHRLAKTAAGRELLQNQMISPMSFLINPPDKEKNGATSENTSFTELTSGGDNPTVLSTRINNRELPLCLESELPSNILGTSEDEGIKDTLHIFNTLQSLDDLMGETKDGPLSEDLICNRWLEDFSDYFGGVNFSEFREIITATQQYGTNSFTGSLLINANCSTNINSETLNLPAMEQMNLDFDSQESRTAYQARIDQVLSAGDILGISYNPDLLSGTPVPPDRRFGHISSIVAKRCEVSGPQYLIRNSWGNSCHNYSIEFQARCDNGNIWVSADEIFTMSNSIIFFQE